MSKINKTERIGKTFGIYLITGVTLNDEYEYQNINNGKTYTSKRIPTCTPRKTPTKREQIGRVIGDYVITGVNKKNEYEYINTKNGKQYAKANLPRARKEPLKNPPRSSYIGSEIGDYLITGVNKNNEYEYTNKKNGKSYVRDCLPNVDYQKLDEPHKRDLSYYCYRITFDNGYFYVGVTKDVEKRLKAHKIQGIISKNKALSYECEVISQFLHKDFALSFERDFHKQLSLDDKKLCLSGVGGKKK